MPSPIRSVLFNIEAILPGALKIHRALAEGTAGDSALLRERLAEAAPAMAPGAEGPLRRWRAQRELGLIAGIPLKAAGEWIKQAGLRDLFQILVGAEHAGAAWPDPAYYRLAIERTRRPAGECLIVEAGDEGIKLAQATGARVAAIGGGFVAGWKAKGAGAERVFTGLGDPALDALILE